MIERILKENTWLISKISEMTGLSLLTLNNIMNKKSRPFFETKFKIWDALLKLKLIPEETTINDLFSKRK